MSDGHLGAVFQVREFRVVWVAEVVSIAGDQLARVALTVLVFNGTGSASLAAVTYALTFLPALLGGVLLTGLADRYSRRDVMVAADLVRAVLVASMSILGLPLWLLCTLLVMVVLLGPPHAAAQGALLPDILKGELYERGLAIRQISSQTAQLAGFAFGGLIVAAIGSSNALVVNSGTFVLSAVLLSMGLANRSRSDGTSSGEAAEGRGGFRGIVAAIHDIAADPARRALVLLAWLVGVYVVPEALAAPYVAELGAGTVAIGLLMAADPLGSVVGAWLFVRFVPARTRERLVGALAVAAGLPLLICAFRPGVEASLLLWAASGFFSTAYFVQVQASFVQATPAAKRAQAIGIAASGLVASQGIAIMIGGVGADVWSPSVAIAMAGGVGASLSLVAGMAWRRADCRARQAAIACPIDGNAPPRLPSDHQ